jgi:hypothetical protein
LNTDYICRDIQKMKLLKYISTLFFAAYFMLAGTGYNIIHYCCNHCEEAGIEYLVQHSCEDVHQEEAICCNHGNSHPEKEEAGLFVFQQLPTSGKTCADDRHCEIKRIYLGDYASFSGTLITSIPEAEVIDVLFVPTGLLALQNNLQKKHYSPPPENLTLTGRDILTTKQVLII